MEKLKTFFKTYYVEVIFSVMFILLMGFLALPFLNLELLVGEYKYLPELGAELVDEKATTFVQASFYDLLVTNIFELKMDVATSYLEGSPLLTLTNTITIATDWTMMLALIFILLGFIFFIIIKLTNKKSVGKVFNIISILCLFLAIILLVNAEKFATGGVADDVEFITSGYVAILIPLFVMTVISTIAIFDTVKFGTKDMAEIAMLIATALVLDKIKIPMGATGGSINLAGLPLLLIGIRHGPLKSFVGSCVVFGLLSCLFDGYGLQTLPFDYFIAFTGYMMSGVAYKFLKPFGKDNQNKDLGLMIASLVIGGISVFATRMIGSSLSSYIYYLDSFEGVDSVFAAILTYNAVYIGPSAAAATVVAVLLAKPLQMINKRYPIRVETSEEVK